MIQICKIKMIKRTEKLFSLIELLVVISIIAILASILLPALNKAKNVGKKIQCLNNLKQQATGWLMYVEDNNDIFPAQAGNGCTGSGTGFEIHTWHDAIGSKLVSDYKFNDFNTKSLKIFQCSNYSDSSSKHLSYGYNQRLANIKLNRVRTPAFHFVAGDRSPTASTTSTVDDATKLNFGFRHPMSANVFFIDGHANSINISANVFSGLPNIWRRTTVADGLF